MVAIPDPETFRILPDGRGCRMICDVVTPDGRPYDGDPRYVLRRALERMESLGFDTFNVGPEAEYFLFKDEKGTETLDEGGYFAQTTMDAATGVRRDTIRALGLHRIGDAVVVPDNDAIRGMVRQVRFLVSVEELPASEPGEKP